MHSLGRNPARIIPFWREAVESEAASGGVIRGIGEPAWPSRTSAEFDECSRHERLLNLAFGGTPGWALLCPFDTAGLEDRVLEEAARCHPFVHRGESAEPNVAHGGDRGQAFGGVLDPAPPIAAKLSFGRDGLGDVRELVASEARLRAQLSGVASPARALQRLETSLGSFTAGRLDDDVAIVVLSRSARRPASVASPAVDTAVTALAGPEGGDVA
jgi:hypothetical protein